MKPLLILSLFAIASVISIAQKSTTPKETLYDFRANNKTTPIKIPPATQKMVLSKVFRKYLSDSAKCNPQFEASGSDNYLAAARKAGQIAPSIIDSTTGSFTAAGQTQTAYLISVSECGASHADNFGSDRVAIFAGQQLVADLDVDFRSSFARKTDLNVDGIDELLMTSGYMPGHMNVLLAEANVPYSSLYELEQINPEFPTTDVSVVVGANDVVNPDARENPASPIAGMV